MEVAYFTITHDLLFIQNQFNPEKKQIFNIRTYI